MMEDNKVRRGEVLWFNVKRGFGFIRDLEQDDDIFIHYSKINAPMGEFKLLNQGDIVEFERFVVTRGEFNEVNKSQAKNVVVVEESDSIEN